MKVEKDLMTAEEFIRVTGLQTRTARRWLQEGRIPGAKEVTVERKVWLIPRSAVIEIFQRQAEEAKKQFEIAT